MPFRVEYLQVVHIIHSQEATHYASGSSLAKGYRPVMETFSFSQPHDMFLNYPRKQTSLVTLPLFTAFECLRTDTD